MQFYTCAQIYKVSINIQNKCRYLKTKKYELEEAFQKLAGRNIKNKTTHYQSTIPLNEKELLSIACNPFKDVNKEALRLL